MSITMSVEEAPFEPSAPPAMPGGRLRQEGLSSVERNYAVWIHLSPLLASFVLGPLAGLIPLVLWLAKRQESMFDDDHGREVVNMSITAAILSIVAMTGVGLIIWLPWAVVTAINVVRGSVAAGNGEYFRYPMIFRFVSS